MGPGVRRDDEAVVIPAQAGIQQWKQAWVERVGPGVRRDSAALVATLATSVTPRP